MKDLSVVHDTKITKIYTRKLKISGGIKEELRLSPSILSADFARLGEDKKEAVAALGPKDYLHIDVMDGLFVPSISFGFPVIKSIRKITNAIFDVHLMIEDPIRYIEAFSEAGADLITVHVEACKDVKTTLRAISDLGLKCGLSINPETPVDCLKNYLPDVDMILLMTVHPGFGGQAYIDSVTDKIKEVRAMVDDSGYDIDIEVDGGIYAHNIRTVIEAGANVIVCGSAVFNGNITENINTLKSVFDEYKGE